MWIGRYVQGLLDTKESILRAHIEQNGKLIGEVTQLKQENARLHAERAWFMHRLTQVEHERGMLMQDRLGVKIAVPEFVPAAGADDIGEALSKVVDISTVGGDAKPENDAESTQAVGMGYENLPGYTRTRR